MTTKKKRADKANKMLTAADILLMCFFGSGVLIIIALFFYVLAHESL